MAITIYLMFILYYYLSSIMVRDLNGLPLLICPKTFQRKPYYYFHYINRILKFKDVSSLAHIIHIISVELGSNPGQSYCMFMPSFSGVNSNSAKKEIEPHLYAEITLSSWLEVLLPQKKRLKSQHEIKGYSYMTCIQKILELFLYPPKQMTGVKILNGYFL